MSMHRFAAILLLWVATVLPQVSQAAVAALSAHVPLQAASLYTGGEHVNGGEQRVELYLLDGNFFVLRQIAAPKGKKAVTRDMTGSWRQVEDGALLQLTNRYGLALSLNIGGSGNLYGDFFPAPDGFPHSLALKKVPFRKPSFSIMGRLDRIAGRATLTDSATGRVFAPAEGDALAALPSLWMRWSCPQKTAVPSSASGVFPPVFRHRPGPRLQTGTLPPGWRARSGFCLPCRACPPPPAFSASGAKGKARWK